MLRVNSITFDERVIVSQHPTPPASAFKAVAYAPTKIWLISTDYHDVPGYTQAQWSDVRYPDYVQAHVPDPEHHQPSDYIHWYQDTLGRYAVETTHPSGNEETDKSANFTYRVPLSSLTHDDNYGKLFKVTITYPLFRVGSVFGRDFVVSVTDTTGNSNDLTGRSAVSANVFWPTGNTWDTGLFTDPEYGGENSVLDLFPSPGLTATGKQVLYIYPGGDLLISLLTRTGDMPAGVISIEVERAGDLVEAQSRQTPIPTEKTGMWFESPDSLKQVFGSYGGDANTPLARFSGWSDAPSCWDLPQRDRALRNFFDYNHYVMSMSDGGSGTLHGFDVLSFDVVYYKQAFWPSETFANHNWEMPPVERSENPDHSQNVLPSSAPCNWVHWSTAQRYHGGDLTPIADFDLVAYTAALCQAERMKFLPVLDFRGDASLDYLNWEGNPHGSGWDNSVVVDTVETDYHHPVTLDKVCYDPYAASPGLPRTAGEAGLEGYNALNYVVSNEIVGTYNDGGITRELHRSLAPFMRQSCYIPGSDGLGNFSSVDGVGVLMDERCSLNLLVPVTAGDQDVMGWKYNGIDPAWPQAVWGLDDNTWHCFQAYCQYTYNSAPGAYDDPQTRAHRFEYRYNELVSLGWQDAWAQWRHLMQASLLESLYFEFAGSYTQNPLVDPDLVLLFNSPTTTNLSHDADPNWQEPLLTPYTIQDYLAAGACDPAGLYAQFIADQSAAQNVVFVSPAWSAANAHAPTGTPVWARSDGVWLSPWQKLWSRQRMFDVSSIYRDTMQDVYHPSGVLQDRMNDVQPVDPPDPDPGPPLYAGSARGGGWVYHSFIEPGSTDPNAPWGPPHGDQQVPYRLWDLGISCTASAAGTTVSWSQVPEPPYALGTSIPTWAIPYSSLKRYFVDRLNQPMEYRLLGGWQNTAPFGHEVELFKGFNGDY